MAKDCEKSPDGNHKWRERIDADRRISNAPPIYCCQFCPTVTLTKDGSVLEPKRSQQKFVVE